MTTNSLPKNSQAILNAIVESDNPVHFLCDRFASASPKEDEELRGIIRELSQDGFINVKWADNLPYYITINNSARTYGEMRSEQNNEKESNNVLEKDVQFAFISHRSIDAKIADMLVDFLVGVGISKENIFCSSLPGNDIGEKISGEVKNAIVNSKVNILILSNDYYQSAYCLNEAGVIWYRDDIPAIPIALPEITEKNMFGFLNSEYKLRRLDNEADISYIYDVINAALPSAATKVSIITHEMQKLKERYLKYIESERKTSIPSCETSFDDVTTDDERIVLYYLLLTKTRKVTKAKLIEWIRRNELFNVNVDNAFDLLSSMGHGNIADDSLEIDIDVFRRLTANPEATIAKLKPYFDKHICYASDAFNKIWNTPDIDPKIKLFVAYIVEERISSFGDRWMANSQIEDIKAWESKNSLISELSDNYGSCLELFKVNDLVYESSWTSYGNPREYTLYPSLQKLLFDNNDSFAEELLECKKDYSFELPF